MEDFINKLRAYLYGSLDGSVLKNRKEWPTFLRKLIPKMAREIDLSPLLARNGTNTVLQEILKTEKKLRKRDFFLIGQLKRSENGAFELLYKEGFEGVRRHILRNKGNEEDVRDTFQEAIMVLLENLRKEEYKFTSTICGFLFGVCNNLWLRRLKGEKKEDVGKNYIFSQSKLYLTDEDEAAEVMAGRKRILIWALDQMRDDRKSLLIRHHINGEPQVEIAFEEGTKPGTLRVKMHDCRNKLLKIMQQHPDFNKYF